MSYGSDYHRGKYLHQGLCCLLPSRIDPEDRLHRFQGGGHRDPPAQTAFSRGLGGSAQDGPRQTQHPNPRVQPPAMKNPGHGPHPACSLAVHSPQRQPYHDMLSGVSAQGRKTGHGPGVPTEARGSGSHRVPHAGAQLDGLVSLQGQQHEEYCHCRKPDIEA